MISAVREAEQGWGGDEGHKVKRGARGANLSPSNNRIFLLI
jgi:hypothetical protein